MYILRIWGIGRVECASSDALAVVRRRARKSALYLCHRALARTHAAGASVPAITGRKHKRERYQCGVANAHRARAGVDLRSCRDECERMST